MLSDNSVSTAKIQDSTITTAKIADSNVTDNKVGNRTVGDPGQEQLPAGSQTYSLSNWITKLWAWIKYVNSKAGVVSANPTARIPAQNS